MGLKIHHDRESLNQPFLPMTGIQGYGRIISLMAGISFLILSISLYFIQTPANKIGVPIESGIISIMFLVNFVLSGHLEFFKKHLQLINLILILLATGWGFWVGYLTHFPQNEILVFMLLVFAVTLLFDKPNYIVLFGLIVVTGFNILLSINGDESSNLIMLTLFIIIMISVGYLITSARQDLLQKLGADEELLELIFRNASDVFLLLDQDTLELKKWNEKAANWFGSNSGKQNSISLSEIITTEIKKFAVSSKLSQFEEVDFLDNLKNKKWAYLNLNKLEFRGHSLIMANLSDVTELKMITISLNQNQQELELRNKELKDFAHIASHDLQEPLRMVGSFVQLIEKKYISQLDEKAGTYIKHVTDGVNRMQNLIRDLLIVSRLQRSEFIRIETDLEDIVFDVTQNIRSLIEQSGASIAYDKLPIVKANPTQMLQLLQNLISNAIKFQTNNTLPLISIMSEKKGSKWQIGVKDNGIGIDPLYHTKIFEIFKRLHNQSEYQGTGIGLAICTKIVEQHGGRIWVESESGGGSTFWFTLTA